MAKIFRRLKNRLQGWELKDDLPWLDMKSALNHFVKKLNPLSISDLKIRYSSKDTLADPVNGNLLEQVLEQFPDTTSLQYQSYTNIEIPEITKHYIDVEQAYKRANISFIADRRGAY